MDIVIRPVVPGEHTVLGEITAQAYLGDGLLDFAEDDPYLRVLRDVAGRAARAEVLVAAEPRGAVLLGGVTYVGGPGPLADLAGPGEAEIRMLAVARDARRRGVGEALVRACLERARAGGSRRVVLSTQDGMRTAHRIYERLGFRRAPHRDWRPRPDLPDLVLLAYELDL
ncbi:GNAT family N-acetyltransferase [Streptomyces sp. NPDC008150]|uniref:GNAT family N-acetyltransferase n=1 Tax=Streptomyces sp. NPDC008150 TaxID=3364816 RepID=UPI0036F150D7